MTEYRTGSLKLKRPRHWSERSWWNPRRWLAMPLIVGTLGTLATVVGLVLQNLGGGFLPWGAVALLGTLITVGAIAWAQSDINHLRNRER